MDKLQGTLVYVAVDKPVKAFQKEGTPKKADEWKASVVIADEDVVDEFEAYCKSIDANPSIKKVKAADFEEIYKCPVPDDAGKNVWVITLRKSTELGKTGQPVPDKYKPRAYEQTEENGRILRTDITNTKLIGNGSQGIISIDKFERTNGTVSLYLKNILVTELIEYVKPEGVGDDYVPGSEFDDEAPVQEPTKAAPAKPAAKPAAKKANAPKVAPEPEEDPPF